jgi:serine/threonine protein kinase
LPFWVAGDVDDDDDTTMVLLLLLLLLMVMMMIIMIMIMMMMMMSLQIGDLGISKKAPDEKEELMKTFVGTLIYMSPERLSGEPYSASSDIWSLGLTIITLAQVGPTPETLCAVYKVKLPDQQSNHLGRMGKVVKSWCSGLIGSRISCYGYIVGDSIGLAGDNLRCSCCLVS